MLHEDTVHVLIYRNDHGRDQVNRIFLTITAALLPSIASAEVVTPNQVEFVDGAVEASLSGSSGDPAAGAVVMNKGAGNCIAFR